MYPGSKCLLFRGKEEEREVVVKMLAENQECVGHPKGSVGSMEDRKKRIGSRVQD